MDWFETSALNLQKAFCELKNHNSQPIQYVCIFDQCIRNQGAGNPILLCSQCVQEHSKNHSAQNCLELSAFLQQCRQKLAAQKDGKDPNNIVELVSQKISEFNEKIMKMSADIVESMNDLFIKQLVAKGIFKKQGSQGITNIAGSNTLNNQRKTSMTSVPLAKKPANLQQYKEISDFLKELWKIYTTTGSNNNTAITASKSIAQQLSNSSKIQQSLREKAKDDWLGSSICGFIDEALNHLNASFKQTSSYLSKSQQDLESLTAQKSEETAESNRQQLYDMKLAEKKRDDLIGQLAQEAKKAKLIVDDLKQQQNVYYESQQEEKAIGFRLNMKRQQAIEMQRNFHERIQALTDKQDKLKEYTFYNSEPLGIHSRQQNQDIINENDKNSSNQRNNGINTQVNKFQTEQKYSQKNTNLQGEEEQQPLELDQNRESKQERYQKFMFIERSKKQLEAKLKEGLQPIEVQTSQLAILLEETQLHNSKSLEMLNQANQDYNNQQIVMKQLQLAVSSAEDAIFKLKHELISQSNYPVNQQETQIGQQTTTKTTGQGVDKITQINVKK